MTIPIIIVGSGGHAKVLADALLIAREPVIGFTDINPDRWGKNVLGLPVIGGDDVILSRAAEDVRLVNGIGSVKSCDNRRNVFMRFRSLGFRFATVLHPSSTISASVALGEGAQVMAKAVIQAECIIGENTIVNTGAIVDHDCRIGAHCHIAPGCALSGNVTIGEASHIGTGSTVRQGIRLGSRTVVGVGAAVVSDHGGQATLVGIPARERG